LYEYNAKWRAKQVKSLLIAGDESKPTANRTLNLLIKRWLAPSPINITALSDRLPPLIIKFEF
jgi:hypothetical protein